MFWYSRAPSVDKISFEDLESCFSFLRGENKKSLKKHHAKHKQAHDTYDALFNSNPYAEVQSAHQDAQALSDTEKSELTKIYDSTFGKSHSAPKGKGQHVMEFLREMLLQLPNNRRCSYCYVGLATTLDHFLPKTRFPQYSVCIWNLVPCCTSCNQAKSAKWRDCKQELLLIHPRFSSQSDDWLTVEICAGGKTEPLTEADCEILGLSDEQWKRIERIQNKPLQPVRANFQLQSVTDSESSESKRKEFSFSALQLNQTLAKHMTTILADLGVILQTEYERNGPDGVSQYLSNHGNDLRRADRNHPEGLLYLKLSSDKSYCNGGFRESGPTANQRNFQALLDGPNGPMNSIWNLRQIIERLLKKG